MAMIPYMAAGYGIDRLMGGDGKVGLAAGTGFGGFSTGAFGSALAPEVATAGMTNTVASNAAANSFPEILGSMPTSGTVNPLTTGGFSESISPFTPLGGAGVGGNVGFLGQPISNQVMDSALTGEKGLLGYGLENTAIKDGLGSVTDYIDDGYENMSVMDTINTGMLGEQALDTMTLDTTPQGQIMTPPQVALQGSTPRQSTQANPVAITVPDNQLSQNELEQLYKERMYG